jgi:hypothetical protein
MGDGARTEFVLASHGVAFYRIPAVTPETLSAALVPIKRALAGCPSPRAPRHAAREPPKTSGHPTATNTPSPTARARDDDDHGIEP